MTLNQVVDGDDGQRLRPSRTSMSSVVGVAAGLLSRAEIHTRTLEAHETEYELFMTKKFIRGKEISCLENPSARASRRRRRRFHTLGLCHHCDVIVTPNFFFLIIDYDDAFHQIV